VTPLPELSIAVDVRGRLDAFSDGPTGAETNLYGEPRLTARFSRSATPDLFWGAEADVRLVGSEAPSVHWPATSPSLRALLATRLTDRTWLASQLGFHLDRSAEIVTDDAALTATDRRTLSTSSWNALQWGVGASHRLAGLETELVGEISGELLVGGSAPGFARSPWQLSLGARHPLGRSLALLLTAELGLSARDDDDAEGRLNPAQPRAGTGLSIVWRVNPPSREARGTAPAPVPPPVAPEPAPPPAPPAIPVSPVSGVVVDEGGRPLSDVLVTLERADAEPRRERSFGNGSFRFDEVPEGAIALRAETPGFDPVRIDIAEGGERSREIVLRPAVPAGQVRGRVLSLEGEPIAATVSIQPGNVVVPISDDGSFEIELSPGSYSVRLEHPGYARQRRQIRVHDRGVVILNIALTR
jgi:hypothetical protein